MKFLILIISLVIFHSCSEVVSQQKNNKISIEAEELEITGSVLKNDTTKTHADIPKKYLLGKADPAKDSLFVIVPDRYCLIRSEYIHKDVLEPFLAMFEAALKESVNLKIISAHRTFSVQKWLWDQKYNKANNPAEAAKNVLKYTAMPGTSRHHWGTDIDILSTNTGYFETPEGKKAYNWLIENAPEYGFYQVYTSDRETGYNEEKWHWSYLAVANDFLENYIEKITYKDFYGFNGSETAEELKVIENYVVIN